MQTFYMFGTYSSEALKRVSAERTDECRRIIDRFGGEIILMDALLGDFDLAFIIKFATSADALKTSLALKKLTGITFRTCPAVSVADFDRLAQEL